MDSYGVFEQKSSCIQDEMPFCTDACPAGLEVKAFLRRVAKGDLDSAYRFYQKTVLFADILCRVCAAPCQSACLRQRLDEPVSIRALERACAAHAGAKRPELFAARPRAQRVAVVGGGLCGLTCAVVLARKGYPVELYERENRLGGRLWGLERAILPAEVIEQELAALLEGLPVTVHLSSAVAEENLPRADAVLLATGTGEPLEWESCATDTPGLFAAGRAQLWQPLEAMLRGKVAARSIERYFQGVPLLGEGEREGRVPTRLHTPLTGEEPRLPAVQPGDGRCYTRAEAMEEAGRCLQCECMACVKTCDFMQHYQRYPKHYINDAQQSLRTLKSLQAKLAARQTNSCNLCGLCKERCPSGVDMGQVYMHSRRLMLQYNNLPAAFHDFWLRDMAFSQSEQAALSRPQPGYGVCSYLLFPGCQMGGADLHYVTDVYGHLTERLDGGVALELGCCGAPAEWGGYHGLTEQTVGDFKARWQGLGRPKVILACPTCQKQFARYHPEVETLCLWEMFLQTGLPPQAERNAGPLAVFDPCASRYIPQTQAAVRHLLEQMGARVEELPNHGRYAQCCGYGGLTYGANPELTVQIVRRRAEQSSLDYVTYCTNCRDTFAYVRKGSWHMLDLLFGRRTGRERAPVSLSQKRENRRTLKTRLLREIWGEDSMPETRVEMHLQVAPALQRKLDERLILLEEVEAVIRQAEESGVKLRKADGHLAAHLRLGIITYWVEYETSAGGFVLHNAYSHRMQLEVE